MHLKSISLNNFRNIKNAKVELSSGRTVLEGINGQGKTNLIEAIYILSYGSSFRTSHLRECVMKGEEGFTLTGIYIDEFGIEERVRCTYFDGKRHIVLNSSEINDRAELIYHFPTIVFSHSDILFISGEPEIRRRFFDQMMALSSRSYFMCFRRYRHLLMQRNAALKGSEPEIAKVYDERLIREGLNLINERKKAIETFNSIFTPLYRKISNTDLELKVDYSPSWKEDSEDALMKRFSDTFQRDAEMKTTTSGPHRDRYTLMSPSGAFSQTGSTGQVRLSSVIFRIAESKHFSSITRKKALHLVDDVLLELDEEKRERALSYLGDSSQSLYTFLPSECYGLDDRETLKYRVVEGNYEPI